MEIRTPWPNKLSGADAPFFEPGFQDAVRLSGHLASTTRKHRRSINA
jgi:hypothetical protein